MKTKFVLIFFISSLIFFISCRKADLNYVDNDDEWLSGGKQTFFDFTTGGFDHIFLGLNAQEQFNHGVGDAAFDATFVTAPAPINAGLGPLYNNVACSGCHAGDGRGRPPVAGQQLSSMLFRISIPGTDEFGGPNPVPGFGGQFHPRAIAGKVPEGNVNISYSDIEGFYADGTKYTLKNPTYTITNSYMAMPSDVMLSPRVAPQVFGLGLLEAIPNSRLMALADENDADGDGISGKVNWVYDVISKGLKIGKFGWKAGQPSLLQQSAGAYNEDMGITSFVFPIENSLGQPQHVVSTGHDISDSLLHAVNFYMQTLGVPARRKANDPIVLQGKNIFYDLKCIACHTPSHRTGVDMTFPSRSNQKIFPYTDLLLHDMGAGLADNRPEYLANGNEWRTPPLWGLGLIKKVNGHEFLMHDGRARNITEAILWHGGEALASQQKFLKLTAQERLALIRFIESL